MSAVASAAFLRRSLALVLFLTIGVGCRGAAAPGPVTVRLDTPAKGPAVVEVSGIDPATLRRLSAGLTPEQWNEVLRVSIGDGQPAMIGTYAVVADKVRFTPMFALDPGRPYFVVFRAASLGTTPRGVDIEPVRATVRLPAHRLEPTTVVSHVFPSGETVPENQLRLYIHFSAPMGLKGGLDHVRLLDDRGREVVDPFLPLDAEFWNDDRTRYTVFFDPGRQKRGILPNQQMGRSLERGRRYTLVVDRDWRDGHGLPLKETFHREFSVRPADERPLNFKAWRLAIPASAALDPLVVTFNESLDHGLLLRALGVMGSDGAFIKGDVAIEANETRWSFTPSAPWVTGRYQLVALSMLEDLAGNRIGRAFEVDRFDRADQAGEPERTAIPFIVAAR